jgi:hypothetical protein
MGLLRTRQAELNLQRLPNTMKFRFTEGNEGNEDTGTKFKPVWSPAPLMPTSNLTGRGMPYPPLFPSFPSVHLVVRP